MGMENLNMQPAPQERLDTKTAATLQSGDRVVEYDDVLKSVRNAGSSQQVVLTFESGFEVTVDRDEEFTVQSR
jgi:hypothetical protein